MRKGAAAALAALVLLSGEGCRAEPWPLWESYQAKFLDGQGRVIDHGAADRTTTEGEAYAMFFALVANDRTRFDRLLDWTEANMAAGDLSARLPAWSWGKGSDGGWHVLDAHPAADADLWMAYTLEEAGRLWRSERYTHLGNLMAGRIAQQEIALVPGLGTTMLPGAEGFHPSQDVWVLNPSYLPPMLLAYFAHEHKDAPWSEVMRSVPELVATPGGYVMDWMITDGLGVKPSAAPAALEAGKTDVPSVGSYDAIRMYLWVGISDPKTPGLREVMAHMRGMALYVSGHATPPGAVDASGRVLVPTAPPGFSAAVAPYLEAMGLHDLARAQMQTLAASRDAGSGLYGKGGDYYDQNLAMFATGWSEGRFRFGADGKLKVKWAR